MRWGRAWGCPSYRVLASRRILCPILWQPDSFDPAQDRGHAVRPGMGMPFLQGLGEPPHLLIRERSATEWADKQEVPEFASSKPDRRR
jgi:hypothetical protein